MSWLSILRRVLGLFRDIAWKLQPPPVEPRKPQPPPKRHTDQDEMIRRQRELYRKNHPGGGR